MGEDGSANHQCSNNIGWTGWFKILKLIESHWLQAGIIAVHGKWKQLVLKQRHQLLGIPARQKRREVLQFKRISLKIGPAGCWGGDFTSPPLKCRQRCCLSNHKQGRYTSQIISSKMQPLIKFIAELLHHIPKISSEGCASCPAGMGILSPLLLVFPGFFGGIISSKGNPGAGRVNES